MGIINGAVAGDANLGFNAFTWSATAMGLTFLVWLGGAAVGARGARMVRERERRKRAAALTAELTVSFCPGEEAVS